MVLKDWSLTKYSKSSYTVYRNVRPEFKSFEDNYYVVYGDNGSENWCEVIKEGKQILIKRFKSFDDARKFAKKYMVSH